MLMRPWLSRWSWSLLTVGTKPRRTRRRAINPVAARVQTLEPRVLLTAAAAGSEFQVNTYTTGNQRTFSDSLQSVAMDADGDYVITWSSKGQDGSGYGVYAQRYNAAGVALGNEFRVNSYTTVEQRYSMVAMDADGDFAVTWTSNNQDGSNSGIYAQRYNAAGVAQGSEFRVNTYTTGNQQHSTVAMDADGDFVVTWQSQDQDGDGFGIFAQRYNAAGVAQAVEFQVSTYTTDYQVNSTVAMDADGDFVVAWSSDGQDGSLHGIYAQRYAGGSVPTANDAMFTFAENRPIGYVVGTVIATDPDAGDSLTYALTGGNTGNAFAINPMTGQITVNSVAPVNFEINPTFALTVTATDSDQLADTATITINLTDLNEAPVFLQPTMFTIAENRSVGYVVSDVNTSDPEGNTVTYSIVGGDPNAQFAINATTGVITVAKATINFEVTSQFLLQVKAQDNGSPANSRTQTITVNITNLNEAPAFLAPTTFSIAENRSVGTFVGDVNTVDPEGNTVTYSIVGGGGRRHIGLHCWDGHTPDASPLRTATPAAALRGRRRSPQKRRLFRTPRCPGWKCP
ncbi:MAG TPA: cadherin domain-containing protein [Planctomycetaceae bacterium]|nr:cadherin domain-containing protein [Planctomycetaceae bacterium]